MRAIFCFCALGVWCNFYISQIHRSQQSHGVFIHLKHEAVCFSLFALHSITKWTFCHHGCTAARGTLNNDFMIIALHVVSCLDVVFWDFSQKVLLLCHFPACAWSMVWRGRAEFRGVSLTQKNCMSFGGPLPPAFGACTQQRVLRILHVACSMPKDEIIVFVTARLQIMRHLLRFFFSTECPVIKILHLFIVIRDMWRTEQF